MSAITACLECSAPLGPADGGGLCPKCLLKLGLATQLSEGHFAALAEGLRPDGSVEEPFAFGAYRILRLLGKGGMGAVYEAEQMDTGRRVALKVLGKSLDTPEMRQRFLREGQLAAAVRHTHVVSILAAEEIEDTPVIVMELLHEGTLKDRVSRRGPLPVREAVDAVLQIVDGLEAAHAVGVLHRDVKPGNCFSSAEGEVKVGDFGLSISTLVKAEQSLTKSGTVLGTPAFAAPEQLRGEEIDARADIYAVGATLYYLLSGKPAFEGESLVALIAAVLEKKPVHVRALRPELPRTLAQIVMRCLEKERVRRFRNYAALRAALIPYSSAATTPATLGLRSVAGVIDAIALGTPVWVLEWFGQGTPAWAAPGTLLGTLSPLAGAFLMVAWYAVPEACWGRSFGKWLCGLRVVRAGGGPIGWGAAFGRAALFSAPDLLGTLLGLLTTFAIVHPAGNLLEHADWIFALLGFAYWLTIRRANGFAALHDLATRTRVVLEPQDEEDAPHAMPAFPETMTEWGEAVGPYRLLRRDGNLAEAFDPALRRRVWVQFHPPGTPPLAETRVALARGSRLRWLLGRRSPEENWDVFEQPAGQPLATLAGSRQPWSRVRRWLADLSSEVRTASAEGSLPPSISLGYVWITAGRRAVLLDFPAPGVPLMPSSPMAGVLQMQDFLSAAADLVLSPVQPLGARQFLDSLRRRCFEATAIVAGNLQALLNRPASVNRARRALNILLVPLLFLSTALVDVRQTGAKFDAAWRTEHPAQPSPRIALELLDNPVAPSDARLRKVAAHLAQHFGIELVEDAFWQKPSVQELVEHAELSRFPASMMIAQELGVAERAAAAGQPGGQSAADQREVERLLARETAKEAGQFPRFLNAFRALAAAYFLALLVALVFGIPMTTRLLAIAVVRADGQKAGRLRMAWRTFVAALPVIVMGGILLLRDQDYFERPIHAGWPAGALLASFALIVALGIIPRRALEDRLAGTWLVPR